MLPVISHKMLVCEKKLPGKINFGSFFAHPFLNDDCGSPLETMMKKFFLALFALALATPMALADDSPLGTFEKCNNWARQYCVNPTHAEATDAKLLELKQKGIPITLQRIKMIAARTNPYAPAK
jgi:hypothetical protein